MKHKSNAPTLWIWGTHAVLAALQNEERSFEKLILTQEVYDEMPEELLKKCSFQILERREMERVLPAGAVHQGIGLKTKPLPQMAIKDLLVELEDDDLLLILDHVTDPHNVGAILRTCAAFNVKALIMTDRNAPPLSGSLAKTASGALERLPVIFVTNLVRTLDTLKRNHIWVIGLAEEGTKPLDDTNLPGKKAIVMGAEGEGLRRLTREHCDILVNLPTNAEFPTLNVSVAAGISIYALAKK
ncbi:23S rRNA (guanosine-2'-O-)-methyltransferase RlmB [Candidatus Bealeia paramacronuclearis]|uniref:23S rRNA (Guanosine-2'-O-)-methyltransferase RlmB n=1 Tax=Candidatus Bealeia paramacronuclearis TaxID=1921001 RepID=A0ABZ2C379_9PROT|nr:23S rRNA (guanosine-2'-O-)-methyltransferase RlmB [Candidatus Bealeia paramacronuclearis]